jgi:hypothetical protein
MQENLPAARSASPPKYTNIYQYILQHVDPSSLSTLCTVSQIFRSECERTLYFDIDLSRSSYTQVRAWSKRVGGCTRVSRAAYLEFCLIKGNTTTNKIATTISNTLVDLAGDVIMELFNLEPGDIRIPKVVIGCAERVLTSRRSPSARAPQASCLSHMYLDLVRRL